MKTDLSRQRRDKKSVFIRSRFDGIIRVLKILFIDAF